MDTKDTSMYYNADDTLSRNRLFNFVVGARGAGKTYGAKKRAIKNFTEKGEQFVYLRRYDTEMPQSQMRNFSMISCRSFRTTSLKRIVGYSG